MSDKTLRDPGNLLFLRSLPRQRRLHPSKDMFLAHNLHPLNPPIDNLNQLLNRRTDNPNLLHNLRTDNLNLLRNLPSDNPNPPRNPRTGNRNLLLSLDKVICVPGPE